jgi:hypothetical protein
MDEGNRIGPWECGAALGHLLDDDAAARFFDHRLAALPERFQER